MKYSFKYVWYFIGNIDLDNWGLYIIELFLVKCVFVVFYNCDVFILWNIIEFYVLIFYDEKNIWLNVIVEIKYLCLLFFDVIRYLVDYDNYVFLK